MSDLQSLGQYVSGLIANANAEASKMQTQSNLLANRIMTVRTMLQNSSQRDYQMMITQLSTAQAALKDASLYLVAASSCAQDWLEKHVGGGSAFSDSGGASGSYGEDAGMVTGESEDSGGYTLHLSREQVNARWQSSVESIKEQISNYRDALHDRGVPDCKWLDQTLAKHEAAMLEQAGYDLDVASGHANDTVNNGNAYQYPINYPEFYDQLAAEFRTHCAQTTNPNYDPNIKNEWYINCQRCVPTYELLRRGMDVTVKPCPSGYDDLSFFPFRVWENPSVISCDGKGNEYIEAVMSAWGDGARAQIVVAWTENNGHTFIAEQINGVTHYIDPQSGNEVYNDWIESALSGHTQFCRIDNLEPSVMITNCYQERS